MVREKLLDALATRPPFTRDHLMPLNQGTPREWPNVPAKYRARSGNDPLPHPFGNLWTAWLWAKSCGEKTHLLSAFDRISATYTDFKTLDWHLDPAKGDLYANRYIASLLAFAEIAKEAAVTDLAGESSETAVRQLASLVAWWQRAAQAGTLQSFEGSRQLDPFINRGDAISFKVAPHRHKIALFRDLTPEIAAHLNKVVPEAVATVYETFSQLYPTWHLQGEERQVHFGENFVDPPDLALGAFKALAWLRNAAYDELAPKIDIPFARADLYYIEKLAITLSAHRFSTMTRVPAK